MDNMEFREVSSFFHQSLPKKDRAEQGIYFTPKKVRVRLFEKLTELQLDPRLILEPSFGTGEFLMDASDRYPSASLIGVEKNPALFQSYPLTKPTVRTFCEDFLDWKQEEKSDLIVGNPPYFVMKGKYPECMTGRPNIYVLFLYKCLTQHLVEGGTLAFILPTSIYNSAYYQPMRDYLYRHTTIRHLETLNKPGFYETSQDTTLLILQQGQGPRHYFFDYKQVYLSPYSSELKELLHGTKTLNELGLGVKTGNVVWNQHKEALSDEGTLLVYSSNLQDGKLVFPPLKDPKKQYIRLNKPLLEGPHLLVERGYGNGYLFDYAIINQPCYAENHVNVIYPKNANADLEVVVKSFRDPRTSLFLKYFIGNGSLSATELESLFPIFV
jgi:adenine-specific DNA-methyltransferase